MTTIARSNAPFLRNGLRTTPVALLFVFLLSLPSYGYIRRFTQIVGDTSPAVLVRTDNAAIQFLVNSSVVAGVQSNATGKNVTVISPLSDPQAAIRASLATWSAVGTANARFLPLQSTTLGIDPTDNKMVIAIGASANDLSALGAALAVTATSYAASDGVLGVVNVTKGAITDTDIILNPADAFSTDGSTSVDLQAVMTHELGHALGANHTGLLGATMFQLNSGQRFLTADDLTFANVAYPLANSGPALGTISGTVTATGGTAVPYALLTAFDTSAGVTVGGIANPDGTYSFQIPPGNYQIYAEPLNGLIPINLYLASDQVSLAAGTKFQTTLHSGSLSVTANSTATANITVTPGATSLNSPYVAVSSVGGNPGTLYVGGPATVPSGQSVDLVLAGAGFDSTLKDSNFAFYGQGVVLHPGSVRVDKTTSVNGFNILRVTLDVAAITSPSLASFVVTSGSNSVSFSGALVIVPPTPGFVSAGVISAAPYTGIQGGVSPGGIYSIYDIPNSPNLGPATLVQNAPSYDAYGNIATTLAGVTVTFDGVPAPLFLSWGNQLNFQVPYEVAGKTSTLVVVNYLGSASASVKVPVLAVQPGFFTSDGKAVRAYNLPSYTVNTAQNPAPAGSYVEVYGTGVGKLSNTIATGHGDKNPSVAGSYTYSVGGSPAAPTSFGGLTSGSVGLAQWDVQIPSGMASGPVSIIVTDTASGATSQPGATIFVK